MKKSIYVVAALLAIGATLSIVSCNKVEDEVANTTTTAEDITRSETYLAAVFNVTDDIASTDGRLSKTGSTLLPAGASLVFTDSIMDTDGVTYYIDYGSTGILCFDGVTRAGRLDIQQVKQYSETGCIVTVNVPETNNFKAGTGGSLTKISGTAVATRLDATTLHLVINNGKTENATDGTVTFNSDKVIIRTEMGQPGIAEDEFKLYGSGAGVNSKGKNYTWNTQDTIVKMENANCPFPISGIIALTTEGSEYKIDFAPDSKACDKKVTITLPNGTKIPKTF